MAAASSSSVDDVSAAMASTTVAPAAAAAAAAPAAAPVAPVDPELEARIQSVVSVGEECISEAELRRLLTNKPAFRLYDGFEPSGRMHIAQGIFKALNVNKCTKAGGHFVIWVADWFALMNDKMGGDLEKIKTVGKYLIEVWKAVGMELEHVEFRWASDDINNDAEKYWNQMLEITRCFNMARVRKCCQIMGRLEDNLTAAQILYPLMQCTDVFFLRADVCQLGMDQRKVNMLARDYCDSIRRKNKPIILSHHMLFGLKEGQEKMSKSDPDSAIFMEDSAEDVVRKISNAYCPTQEKETEVVAETADATADATKKETMTILKDNLKNPLLDYTQYMLMASPTDTLTVGATTFATFESLKEALCSGKITPDELKHTVATEINVRLEDVRAHFRDDETARELLAKVREYKREDVAAKPKRTRRLQLSLGEADKPKVCAVFTSLPNNELTGLAAALDLLNQLRAVPADHVPVIYHSDLSALVMGAFTAEKKMENVRALIKTSFSLVVGQAKRLAPELFEGVKECWQSECMLTGSDEYWISVIHIGRHFQLNHVLAVNEESNLAGQVVAALMHVADVMATGASVLVCGADSVMRKMHALAVEYIVALEDAEVLVPVVQEVSAVDIYFKEDKTDKDSQLWITDNAASGALKKVTRAFCEEGNIDNNPCLSLAVELCIKRQGSLSVKRAEEYGGDVHFTSAETLTIAFKEAELHPGDLKTGVKEQLSLILAATAAHGKADKAYAKGVKELAAYAKKASKAAKVPKA